MASLLVPLLGGALLLGLAASGSSGGSGGTDGPGPQPQPGTGGKPNQLPQTLNPQPSPPADATISFPSPTGLAPLGQTLALFRGAMDTDRMPADLRALVADQAVLASSLAPLSAAAKGALDKLAGWLAAQGYKVTGQVLTGRAVELGVPQAQLTVAGPNISVEAGATIATRAALLSAILQGDVSYLDQLAGLAQSAKFPQLALTAKSWADTLRPYNTPQSAQPQPGSGGVGPLAGLLGSILQVVNPGGQGGPPAGQGGPPAGQGGPPAGQGGPPGMIVSANPPGGWPEGVPWPGQWPVGMPFPPAVKPPPQIGPGGGGPPGGQGAPPGGQGAPPGGQGGPPAAGAWLTSQPADWPAGVPWPGIYPSGVPYPKPAGGGSPPGGGKPAPQLPPGATLGPEGLRYAIQNGDVQVRVIAAKFGKANPDAWVPSALAANPEISSEGWKKLWVGKVIRLPLSWLDPTAQPPEKGQPIQLTPGGGQGKPPPAGGGNKPPPGGSQPVDFVWVTGPNGQAIAVPSQYVPGGGTPPFTGFSPAEMSEAVSKGKKPKLPPGASAQQGPNGLALLYRLQKGDTSGEAIAKKFGKTANLSKWAQAMIQANSQIKDWSKARVGQTVRLPLSFSNPAAVAP